MPHPHPQFIFGHLTILWPDLPAQSLSQKPSSLLELSAVNRKQQEGSTAHQLPEGYAEHV